MEILINIFESVSHLIVGIFSGNEWKKVGK